MHTLTSTHALVLGVSLAAVAAVGAYAFHATEPTFEEPTLEEPSARSSTLASAPDESQAHIVPIEPVTVAWDYEFGSSISFVVDWVARERQTYTLEPDADPTSAPLFPTATGEHILPAGNFVADSPHNLFGFAPEALSAIVASGTPVQGSGIMPACAVQPILYTNGTARFDVPIGTGGEDDSSPVIRRAQYEYDGKEHLHVRAELLDGDLMQARRTWWTEGYVGSLVEIEDIGEGRARATLRPYPAERTDVVIVGAVNSEGALQVWAQEI